MFESRYENKGFVNSGIRCLSHVTKIRVSWTHDSFKFEESAPFSYTYRNFQVSECVGFEESAPFSYSWIRPISASGAPGPESWDFDMEFLKKNVNFLNVDKLYEYQPNYLPTYNLNHPLLPKYVPKYLPKYVPNCMPNHLPNQFPRDAFRNLQSKHRGMQKGKHLQKQTHKPKPNQTKSINQPTNQSINPSTTQSIN